MSLEICLPDYSASHLVRLVQLTDPETGRLINNHRIQGMSRLDLVVKYSTCQGKYDSVIAELKKQFPIEEISVMRTRDNIWHEGYSDAELRSMYEG